MPVGTVRVSDDFVSGTRAAAIGGTTTIIDYVTVARGTIRWRLSPRGARGPSRRSSTGPPPHIHRGRARVGRRGRCRDGDHVLQALSGLPGPPAGRRRHDRAPDARRPQSRGTSHAALRKRRCHRGAATGGARGGPDRGAGARSDSAAVLEGEAVGRAAALAEITGASIYIVHVSSAPALAAVRAAQERGVDVKAETCPQYLYLDSSRLEGPDAIDFVCTPPLRDPGTPKSCGRDWHAATSTRSRPTTARSGAPTGVRASQAVPVA